MKLRILLTVLLLVFLTGCIETLDDAGNVILPDISEIEITGDLISEDIEEGEGPEAKTGDKVLVNYRGTLDDGTQFDSSYDEGRVPFEVTIGAGQVIAGWEEGLVGMKVGGKRKLIIPPGLAYGDVGQGDIPPNATITFEVELMEIIQPEAPKEETKKEN